MSSKDAQAPSGDKIFLQFSCHLGTSNQSFFINRGGILAAVENLPDAARRSACASRQI